MRAAAGKGVRPPTGEQAEDRGHQRRRDEGGQAGRSQRTEPSQPIPRHEGGADRRRRPRGADGGSRPGQERQCQGHTQEQGQEAGEQVRRGENTSRPPQLDPVEGDSQGFRILRPRAELQRRRAAHLAQLHGALAPAPRRLRPLVDRSSRRQQGDVGRAVGEAREAQSRGQRTGYDAHGQLDARAVERPAEHGLPVRAQSVALPGAEAAGEGLVARAQVDEEGRRSLQQGQDGEQGQGPEGGSGQGGPKEAGHPQARP